MTERKNKAGSPRAKGRKRDPKSAEPAVIDVGGPVAEPADEDEEREGEADGADGLDVDLAHAAIVDVDADEDHDEHEGADEADHERPLPARRESGSLARRDPLAAYMAETRRYPLL